MTLCYRKLECGHSGAGISSTQQDQTIYVVKIRIVDLCSNPFDKRSSLRVFIEHGADPGEVDINVLVVRIDLERNSSRFFSSFESFSGFVDVAGDPKRITEI